MYLNGQLVTDLVIPDNVTSIKDYAFRNYDSLTSVAIGDGVTSIGSYAFYGCDSLTSVTIGDGRHFDRGSGVLELRQPDERIYHRHCGMVQH